jgi:hypothetical protein
VIVLSELPAAGSVPLHLQLIAEPGLSILALLDNCWGQPWYPINFSEGDLATGMPILCAPWVFSTHCASLTAYWFVLEFGSVG